MEPSDALGGMPIFRSEPAKLSGSKRSLHTPSCEGVFGLQRYLKKRKGSRAISRTRPLERFSSLVTRLQSLQLAGVIKSHQ